MRGSLTCASDAATPPALAPDPRLLASLGCAPLERARLADARRRDRLAGVLDPPQPARPRPRRADGVPAAAGPRAAGGPDRGPAAATRRHRGRVRAERRDCRAARLRDARGRARAVAVPRDRRCRGRRERRRQSRAARADAGDRAARAAARCARAARRRRSDRRDRRTRRSAASSSPSSRSRSTRRQPAC